MFRNTQSTKVYYYTASLQLEILMYMPQKELMQNKPVNKFAIIYTNPR